VGFFVLGYPTKNLVEMDQIDANNVKRKLTAILSADVEGYSRLMGEDEIATIRTLKNFKEIMATLIQQYRGRVVDAPGDNLLAEFASVVDAVQCAVEIQREIAECNEESSQECKMNFRIGINLGDVVEEEDRIYGDGVNIAARMESLCEGGGVCISGTAFEHVENKLDLEFEDLGEHEVKNITKPVRVYRVLSYPGAAAHRVIKAKKTITKKWSKTLVAVVSAFVVFGVVAVWYFYFRPPIEVSSAEKTVFPLPDKPSIAVLPFENLSDDPKQEYFADGLTEDLIINLSLYRELFVISRNSSFTYKGTAVDVKRVGRELGVAFVVEGSVRRENDQVRVNTQLIDAQTGSNVWADRFDRELTGIFAVQDEITRAIAGRLAPEVAKARIEGAKDKPTDDLEAWDLYLRARDTQSNYTRNMQEEAIRLGGLSIARDPGFAAPYGLIARAKGTQFFYRWADDPERTLADAIEHAQSAIRLSGNDPAGYAALGYVYRLTGDETRSIANLERAAELNPNDANIRLELAHTLDWFRQQERALPEILEAIRLSPRDPRLQMMLFYKSHILFHLRDFEASLAAAKEMSSAMKTPTWRTWYHLIRAANFAQLGRSSEAKAEIESALTLNPKLSLASMRRRFEGSKNHPENRRIWLDSLRKAGLK